MTRVLIDYTDGHYSMYKPRKNATAAIAAWYAANTIEIPDEEWARYQLHVEEGRKWHRRIQELDNEVYRRNHPEEESTP